jgi:hypothetical protein
MAQTEHPERHEGKTTAIIFVVVSLLIFGIFSWGLEYKLSLYQAAQTRQSTVPAAKLLSQKERPQTQKDLSGVFGGTQQKIFATSNMLHMGMLCAVFFCLPFLQNQKIISSQNHSSNRRLRSYTCYFSFRPPPILCA